jgi:E3 ubiquitin-protein ligase SHPRH
MAQLIPHINEWAISGTPDVESSAAYLGLLKEYRSACKDSRMYRQLLSTIGLRHSKASVAEEMHLPSQHRNLIRCTLGPVERQYYRQLIEEMIREERRRSTIEANESLFVSNHWFLTLRQAWYVNFVF